jgi:hypothetical protein
MKSCLGIVMCLLVGACSDPPTKAPADESASSSSSSSSSGATVPDFGGSTSSSSSSSSGESAPRCNALATNTPHQVVQRSESDRPTPTGGTFEDGRYSLEQLTLYQGSSVPSGLGPLAIYVEKVGLTLQMYVRRGDAAPAYRTYTVGTADDFLRLTQTCPSAGTEPLTLSFLYSASASEVRWFESLSGGQWLEYRFVKRR